MAPARPAKSAPTARAGTARRPDTRTSAGAAPPWLWVAWIVCGAVALAVVSAEWYAWAYPIAALTGYHVFFACSKLADRQIERRGPPR